MTFTVNASDSLVALIDHIRQENNVSAALVIIVDKDNVIIQSHLGTSSWLSKSPFNPTNMFRIGSISKSFAAILALRLQQSGIIDLKKTTQLLS